MTQEIIRTTSQDARFVAKTRQRLGDLGWFMKSLKEPLARMANEIDGATGALWQSRYKSIAVLDTQALLATNAYIDLNLLAAGLVQLPEQSTHTSIHVRIEHCRQHGRLDDLMAARHSSVNAIYFGADSRTSTLAAGRQPRFRGVRGTVANAKTAWQAIMSELFTTSRPTGVAFAFDRAVLRAEVIRRGRHHLANFAGCPA